jgi:hypothetical protein
MGGSALVVEVSPKRNMFELHDVFSTDQERRSISPVLFCSVLAWAVVQKLEELMGVKPRLLFI